jgi:hypothetical protein
MKINRSVAQPFLPPVREFPGLEIRDGRELIFDRGAESFLVMLEVEESGDDESDCA